MRRFAALLEALDALNALDGADASGSAARALRHWLAGAAPEDAAWGVFLLSGGTLRAAVPAARLRALAIAAAGIDEALFATCLKASGDLAETVALVWPAAQAPADEGLAQGIEQRALPLRGLSAPEQDERLGVAFGALDGPARALFVRLVAGGLRIGLAAPVLQRALAQHAGLDVPSVALRLAQHVGVPTGRAAARWHQLLAPADASEVALPLPFAEDAELGSGPEALGAASDWAARLAYDGPRVQLVRRVDGGQVWSAQGELWTARLPELAAVAQALPPHTAIEGVLLVWPPGGNRPAPRARLQARLARKTVPRRLPADAPPLLLADDLLLHDGADLRALPLHVRHERLHTLMAALQPVGGAVRAAPLLHAPDWPSFDAWRQRARQAGASGLRLMRAAARPVAAAARPLADAAPPTASAWCWPAEAQTVAAVVVQAQAAVGGQHAGLLCDVGVALWSRTPASADEAQAVVAAIAARQPPQPGALQLVPLARTAEVPDPADAARLDRLARAHTVQNFGPVRSLRPTLVVDLAFDAVEPSARHRSGLVLRRPRVLGLCPERPLHAAGTLPTLRVMLPPAEPAAGDAAPRGDQAAGSGADG